MDIGIHGVNVAAFATHAGAEAICEAAVEFELESVWAWEQIAIPEGFKSPWPYSADGKLAAPESLPLTDPFSWLTWIGAKVPGITLGTGVALLPLHQPIELAKRVASIDLLSQERFILGVGIGWLAEEYALFGRDFATRGRQADNAINALRCLWAGSPASFESDTVSFPSLYCEPRPNRQVPIVVAGGSRAAAIRAGRLGDGFYPHATVKSPAELVALMRESAAEAGRDPDEVELTMASEADLSTAKSARQLGATRYLINVAGQSPESLRGFLDRSLSSLCK